MSHTTYITLVAAINDGITRLGYGAPESEKSAVRDAIIGLFYAQGDSITNAQCSAIVEAAFKASERAREGRVVRIAYAQAR